MRCIKNMNQATWASCLSLLNLVASFLPHYLSEIKTRSQNSQSKVSPTWDSGRYYPWCVMQTNLRCHCPRAWFSMSNLWVNQMLLSLYFNNFLVQQFLVFLSIPLNGFSFPLERKVVHKKLPQVRHLSLEFYRAGVQNWVNQHKGLFLSLNGRKRKNTFRNLIWLVLL